MKHLFKPQILVVTLLGLIIFSSCTKQDDITLTQSSSDFEILKQDLEKDLHYMKYKKAKAIIFEKLKHADIDLLSIIEQVQKNETYNICEVDPILLADIKGGSLYQQMYCEDVMANLSLVVEKYQDRLSHLEEIEIRQLFEGNATIINTRTDNCLQSFHISIMNADHWCTELFLNMDDERGYYWCLEVSYTNALDIYYRCIGAGGSTDPNCPGCPVPHED